MSLPKHIQIDVKTLLHVASELLNQIKKLSIFSQKEYIKNIYKNI